MTRSRRTPVLLAGVALLTLVTACSIPSRPMWWPHPNHAEPTTSGRASRDPAMSVRTVPDAWQPGTRQLGIQVYWTANRNDSSAAVVQAKAERIIDYAISLHANSIAVTFPFFTYGQKSNAVYGKPGVTPSPAHIAIFLAVAARAHIRVTLRPILDEDALVTQNLQAWRGSIQPQNRAVWFLSYEALLLPYVTAAQQGHAATFVIATELESLEGSTEWAGLISSLKSVYSGELTYDENYDEFAWNTAKPPVPTHNVDAYPEFSVPGSASVAVLTQSWDAWLGTHPLSVRRVLTLSEVGIRAEANSYNDPWAWLGTASAPIDPRVQAAWFQAVCNAVSAEQIGGGIYWWEVNFDANPAGPAPFESDRMTFLDRPAQQVIQNCFAKLSS